jgi:hypothetical protein
MKREAKSGRDGFRDKATRLVGSRMDATAAALNHAIVDGGERLSAVMRAALERGNIATRDDLKAVQQRIARLRKTLLDLEQRISVLAEKKG